MWRRALIYAHTLLFYSRIGSCQLSFARRITGPAHWCPWVETPPPHPASEDRLLITLLLMERIIQITGGLEEKQRLWLEGCYVLTALAFLALL